MGSRRRMHEHPADAYDRAKSHHGANLDTYGGTNTTDIPGTGDFSESTVFVP